MKIRYIVGVLLLICVGLYWEDRRGSPEWTVKPSVEAEAVYIGPLIPIRHRDHAAFYVKEPWCGGPLRSFQAVLITGQPPTAGSLLICGTCGEQLGWDELEEW